MGLFDFLKDKGEKVETKTAAATAPSDADIQTYTTKLVRTSQLPVSDLSIMVENGTATVFGKCDTQKTRERVRLIVGNVQGIEKVDDRMTVDVAEPESTMYTVKSGDSLSKIAKEVYGDAAKYPEIFEANQPMLKDPDKIYPGQVLRIPAA